MSRLSRRFGQHVPPTAYRRPLVSVALVFVAGLIAVLTSVTASWALASSPARGRSVSAAATGSSAPAVGNGDLLIIGTGALGRRVAKLWRQANPDARIVAGTLTANSHAFLSAEGLEPITMEELAKCSLRPLFNRVLFAAPPRRGAGTDPAAYAAAVASATEYLAAPGHGLVFTSSASVFAEDSGGIVDESSQLSSSPSAEMLLDAERATVNAGGIVLRYAGLYDVERGPHTYWLKVGVVKGNPAGLINMVHYDDAAAAAVSALAEATGLSGATLVIADGSPVTREEICKAAVAARPFKGKAMPTFEAPEAGGVTMGGVGSGKILNPSRAREALRWKPRFASFSSFMAQL